MKTSMFFMASLVNRRRNLVFPCALFAAALSVGTAGIATAKQCLVPTIAFTRTNLSDLMGQFADAEIHLADSVEVEDPGGTKRIELRNVRRLTDNHPDADAFPALSPDGKRIVFDSNRARDVGEPLNTSDLFLMKDDGSEQTFLTRGSSASWSPDGKYIAFHRSASGDACPVSVPPPLPGIPGCPINPDPGAKTWDSDIFIAKVGELLENVEPTNITFENPIQRVFINDDPHWSPDGQKIVFTRHHVSDNPQPPIFNYTTAEIYVINADGTGLERLTFNSEEERSPAWSPDGKKIVYSCRKGSLLQICVMNADGTDQMQLTKILVNHLGPRWSPDGEKIVFHRPPQPQQIWVMNADGTDPTQLTQDPPDPQAQVANFLLSWGVVRTNCDKD